MKLCLKEFPIPSALRDLTITLQTNNSTKIYTHDGISKPISFKKGIFQGSSLSPIVFNASINYVFDELNNPAISSKYGFQLDDSLPKLSILGFVDDLAPLADSRISSAQLFALTENLLEETGYKISKTKSKAIIIEHGQLSEEDLILNDGDIISSLKRNEVIKYLGVTFENEIILDTNGIIKKLNEKLSILSATPLLHPDQKLSILNIYIWPIFVYSLQTTPLSKIRKEFLHDIDKIIRSFTKNVLEIPHDTTNHMLYSPKKYKGLELIKAEWETYLQIFNISSNLERINDPYVNISRNILDDIDKSCKNLNISKDDLKNMRIKLANTKMDYTTKLTRLMRTTLRDREYNNWCNLPYKGRGVILFKENPKANEWIFNKSELSYSMWNSCIKMTADVISNKSNWGRSLNGTHCRTKNCNEKETLAHILGFCPHGYLLRITRHNNIRTLIADSFRKLKNYSVWEEVPCLSNNGSNRRIDIIAIKGNSGYVIDPTILFENSVDQPKETDENKKSIYEECIPYLLEKCKIKNIEVIGLMIGARGTITKFFEDFRKRFDLPSDLTQKIVMSVLKGSCNILHNHLYNY